jgi:DNA-binding beta-propeller fold protein YncE
MLRVTPDGRRVWVQTGADHTNVVLDAETLSILRTTPTGREPVTAAFQPNTRRYGLVTHLSDSFVLILDQSSGVELARVDVGGSQANAGFTPDGSFAFVTVTATDEVAIIDLESRTVVGRIRVGSQPMGLVLLDPDAA